MPNESLIIGDIHGCFDEFLELLDLAGWPKSKAQLYLLGDLINKGPKSFEMLEWVRAQKQVRSIIGNHELKFINFCREGLKLSPELLELKNKMGSHLDEWLLWLESLPKYIETEDFILVHGGIVPGKAPSASEVDVLANLRRWNVEGQKMSGDEKDPAWHSLYQGSKLVVYGHWAMQGLCVKESTIGLDTGCVYGKKLSGLLLPGRKIIQVDAKRVYQSFK